ncbi:MAG: hypothetical protein GTO29_14355 [Candidatus Latescibacteria bacterium]|nr:hypothetical protein [Candidatus Latescibacterota bacterium]NIO57328.1 hypothetical protein [Candidatus Latescibacterota bacterium]
MSVTKLLVLFVLANLPFSVLFTAHACMAGFTQVYQAPVNLHPEVIGAAGLGMPAMGTLTLANLPQGRIKKSYLYATQTNNTLGLSATFNGSPLPIASPYASEALLITLSTYQWDVTANILPVVISYGFTVVDGMGMPVASQV